MNAKNFLTVAMIVHLLYGLWYFLAPAGAHQVYGLAADSSPLSLALLQYLGAALLATGIMCGLARNAGPSPGRTAVLAFVAVSSLGWLYLNVRSLGETVPAISWIDIAGHVLLGVGALYFVVQDRKSTAAVAGLA
jgi:uncharacterized protein YjeT (DUF2065 family)